MPETDDLTGCLTQRGLMDALEAEVARSQRQRHRLSCCVIHLEGVKQTHAASGQPDDRRVLATIGPALRASARSHDAVARSGEAEFVVVLPETGAETARRVGERLQAGVMSAVGDKSRTSVGVSVAVAEWDGTTSPGEFLDTADRAGEPVIRETDAVDSEPSPEQHHFDGLVELTREVMRRNPRSRR